MGAANCGPVPAWLPSARQWAGYMRVSAGGASSLTGLASESIWRNDALGADGQSGLWVRLMG
jgi:hypothetical protein